MNSSDLRTVRILAEIKDLQNRLATNGYPPGTPIDDLAHHEIKGMVGRIWLLGFALARPWLPGF